MVNHQHKEELVFNHFVNLLGQAQDRSSRLNWTQLGYEQHDLSELEDHFGEEEIKNVIMHLPNEKAPGPDGFIGLFYKKCWPIIRDDLIAALQAFHSLRTQKLELVNEANVLLIPKTNDSTSVTDSGRLASLTAWLRLLPKS